MSKEVSKYRIDPTPLTNLKKNLSILLVKTDKKLFFSVIVPD